MANTNTKPKFWKRLANSRITSLLLSASVLGIVSLLLWNQYFRGSDTENLAGTANNGDDDGY